jgi:hypothetical protein
MEMYDRLSGHQVNPGARQVQRRRNVCGRRSSSYYGDFAAAETIEGGMV